MLQLASIEDGEDTDDEQRGEGRSGQVEVAALLIREDTLDLREEGCTRWARTAACCAPRTRP